MTIHTKKLNRNQRCTFSTGIDDSLTCSPNGHFDPYGFPEEKCPHFPCDKYKELVKKLDHK